MRLSTSWTSHAPLKTSKVLALSWLYIFSAPTARATSHSPALSCVRPETRASVSPLPGELSSLVHVVVTGDATYSKAITGDAQQIAEVASGDPAWLFYTSGTTGRPKGATLSHRNLSLMALAHYADIDSMSSRDTMIHAAPLSHGCGLWSIASVGRGSNNVVLESASYDAEKSAG